MDTTPVRLTSLAHGGGAAASSIPRCCARSSPTSRSPVPSSACWLATRPPTTRRSGPWMTAPVLIATTDFFTPMVDDPHDFGRIAATNAISDVYAMGGKPMLALAILGMPVGKIAPETVAEILKGGAATCAEAGIPIAGGHSIDTPEPIYGLAVIGSCDRAHLRRNADAGLVTLPS